MTKILIFFIFCCFLPYYLSESIGYFSKILGLISLGSFLFYNVYYSAVSYIENKLNFWVENICDLLLAIVLALSFLLTIKSFGIEDKIDVIEIVTISTFLYFFEIYKTHKSLYQ